MSSLSSCASTAIIPIVSELASGISTHLKSTLLSLSKKIKEADLKKHLEGELNKVDDKLKAEEKAVKDETKKIISKDDLQNDNQLNTSLAVLKSLIIMNK